MRKVFQSRVFYVLTLLLCLLIVAAFIGKNVYSVSAIVKDNKPVSVYKKVSAKNSPALRWADYFINVKPTFLPAEVKWSGGLQKNVWTIPDCSDLKLPEEILATASAFYGDTSVYAQVVGAGTSVKVMGDYLNYIKGCPNIGKVKHDFDDNAELKTISFDNTVIYSMGDVVLTINDGDSDFFDFYKAFLKRSLASSDCKSLLVTSKDFQRSIYYGLNDYRGLWRDFGMRAKFPTTIPTVSNINIGNVYGYKPVTPEPPLPNGFPAELPKAPFDSKPKLPALYGSSFVGSDGKNEVVVPELAKSISFQVPDMVGPGCGWDWTGFSFPDTNDRELKHRAEALKEATQAELNNNAISFIDGQNTALWNLMAVMPDVVKWNHYVSDYNSVSEMWDKFNTARARFKPVWYDFIQSFYLWNNVSKKYVADTNLFVQSLKTNCDNLPDDSLLSTVDYNTDPLVFLSLNWRTFVSNIDYDTVTAWDCKLPQLDKKPVLPSYAPLQKPVLPQIPDGLTIPDSWANIKADSDGKETVINYSKPRFEEVPYVDLSIAPRPVLSQSPDSSDSDEDNDNDDNDRGADSDADE